MTDRVGVAEPAAARLEIFLLTSDGKAAGDAGRLDAGVEGLEAVDAASGLRMVSESVLTALVCSNDT